MIQSQHKAYPPEREKQVYQELVEQQKQRQQIRIEETEEALQIMENRIILKAPDGIWSSQIRLIDPISLKTVQLIQLDNNEAAVSINISMINNELMLLVGTVKDYRFNSKQGHSGGYIHIYRFIN